VTQNFSTRGEPATEFERALVANCAMEFPESMSDIWVVIARRIGVDALVVILDEIGMEKIHVPSRTQFFLSLYRPHRNRLIREMAAAGMSHRQIAKQFGLTKFAVTWALSGLGDDKRAENVVRARP